MTPSEDQPDDGFRPGDRVRVRRQRWCVAEVRAYGDCRVLTLSGIEALNAGSVQRVIAPFDSVQRLERRLRIRVVRMRAWRRRCRALLAVQGPADMLRTAVRARIDLLPHQFEPAIAIVRGLGSRLLIADEVGLGKTIQAGLVVAELIARAAADRVLVLTPAGLREQWAGELSERFGLAAAVVDMRDVKQRAAGVPLGVNPWTTVPIAVASIDFVKRPEVRPVVLACRWDVVIVDEAHGVRPGTDRYDAVAALCGSAPYVLVLTATPHSGDRESFAALCRLGQRDDDRILAFRRSRSEVALAGKRRIHRLQIRPSASEQHMHASLARFTSAIRTTRGDRDRDVWLALATLHKRALSSAYSLARSVARRLDVLPTHGEAGHQLQLPLDDAGGELDGSDEAPALSVPLLDDIEEERRFLAEIADAARAATRRETKLAALGRLLRRLRKRNDGAIVFTEYRDTLLHVRDCLPFACAILHGGLTREERRASLEDFASGRLPILLATDAAGEGLNLHHACRVVINLELPWNPVRLEQRAGRVDRIGQRRTVHAFHLIARDTGETRILDRLKARIAEARRDIATANPLGSDRCEEEAAWHLVAGDDDPESKQEYGSHEGTDAQIVTFAAEAAVEQARLLSARTWADDRDGGKEIASSCEHLIAASRRRTVRSELGSHVLLLSQSVYEDAAGRVLASHLTPFAIRLSVRPTKQTLKRAGVALIRAVQSEGANALDPAYGPWKAANERYHRAFWSTRRARERALARMHRAAGGLAFQPGLFDRRGERVQGMARRQLDELTAEATAHIDMAERASVASTTPSRALLVLVP